jgi:hypothetical protein
MTYRRPYWIGPHGGIYFDRNAWLSAMAAARENNP